MTGIIAGIVALLIIAGGTIPNYANSRIEDTISKSFQSTEKVSVKVYSTPSYKMLGGNYDRVEINIKKPKINNIELDTIKIITSPLKIDSSKLNEAKGLEAIEKAELEALVTISPENIVKTIDLQSLTTRANNFLSNFQFPIPVLSGQVSIDNLNVSFKNNQPMIVGNFIALGGFITAPFTISGDLRVTDKNTIEFLKPQMTLYEEPLIMEELQDMVKYINPVFDINTIGDKNFKINLKRLYFKDDKLRLIGLVNINH